MYKTVLLLLAFGGLLNSIMWAQTTASTAKQTTAGALPDAPSSVETSSSEHVIVNNTSNLPKTSDEDASGQLVPGADPDNHLMLPFITHLAQDQKQFWMAPTHFHKQDLEWIVPFAGVTAGFMEGDSWFSKQIPLGEVNRSKIFSDYATYSLIGVGGGSFLLGEMKGDDQMSEAGLLSGEAAINATAIAYFLRNITQRERPYQANGSGEFFKGGSSFPSEHSAIAWSIASVMAHEYPSTFTKVLAYGLATGISATRVTGQQHFPSDVIVGGALGWYFGRQVFRAHHDTDLGGGSWGSILPDDSGEKTRNPENMGSPDVPLDSWVYPAIERLIAMGYIKSGYLGIRPWTRLECARMLEEAQEKIEDDGDQDGEAVRIYNDLSDEFSFENGRLNGAENLGARIDSVYARGTEISGPPLRDGYHFGQTIINDYGRPYGEGFNSVDGVTAHAEAGALSISVQGEYQHAPAVPSIGMAAQQAVASADLTAPAPNGTGTINQFRLINASLAATFRNLQFSFGKQALWLGVGESGPLLFSNNAESVTMFKVETVSPYHVPLLSKFLGPVRNEYFLGQLSGQEFEFNSVDNTLLGPGGVEPQPFLSGYKASFHPTNDLEFGMGVTAMFAGPGLPFTWGNFARTFYSHTSGANNPGKRFSEFDFSYRVPGLRNWLTIYNDSLVVDEISPIGSNRPTLNPGIYVPQFPKLSKLELRAEGVREPLTNEFAPGFVYYGLRRYRSGYTNDGNLMGNWIGRAGRGGQGWLTYWLSPVTRFQLGYRQQEVSADFLGGGRLVDYSAQADVKLSSTLAVSGRLQYEQWRFPVLDANQQSDTTASVQFNFYPRWRARK